MSNDHDLKLTRVKMMIKFRGKIDCLSALTRSFSDEFQQQDRLPRRARAVPPLQCTETNEGGGMNSHDFVCEEHYSFEQ